MIKGGVKQLGKYDDLEAKNAEEFNSIVLLKIANELAELNRLKRLELSKLGIGAGDQVII
jgi:hypothetical protein